VKSKGTFGSVYIVTGLFGVIKKVERFIEIHIKSLKKSEICSLLSLSMEIIEDSTELKNEDQIELEADAKEFEFLMPLHSLVKLRPFVDRYFLKYYKPFESPFNSGLPNNQYAFMHTNK